MSTALTPVPPSLSPAMLYLAGLGSDNSQRTMLIFLRSAVAAMTDRTTRDVDKAEALSFPWHQLQPDTARLLRAAVDKRFQLDHANGCLSAVRGVLNAADLMTPQLAKALKTIRGEHIARRGRHLEIGEKRKLFRVIAKGNDKSSARDAALLGIGLTCGLRVSEIVGLDREDYDRPKGELLVRNGKGRKDRRLFVTNSAEDALLDWLTVRGEEPGPLFYRIRKGGEIKRERLSPSGVEDVLRRLAGRAGLPRFAVHDMRRTMAGDLLEAGEDIVTVQQLMGHASVTTTAKYDRRPEERRREAQARLTIPYKRAP